MCKIEANIARFEDILTSRTPNHTPVQLDGIREDLTQYKYLLRLWNQFQGTPVDRTTGRLTAKFHPIGPDGNPSPTETSFMAGTPARDVLAWFERRFCLSVRDDFGYAGPWLANYAPVGPEISAKSTPCGEVLLTVATPFELRVPLTENDIFNWLTGCADKGVLIRLSRYAAKCARGLDENPDDFRSRA